MRYWLLVAAAACLGGCDGELMEVYEPPPPRNLDGDYYNRGVDLWWELDSEWDGEPFRVYGKRTRDAEYFFIAEVTSCAVGACVYRDINISPERLYEYYVASVDPDTGMEGASPYSVEIFVPFPVPPPIPAGVEAVALDDAVYLRWRDNSSVDEDFSVYRVYVAGADEDYLLGETDSPGFVDLLAENGRTSAYFVTSVDVKGHESDAGQLVESTPRPDYTGEVVFAYQNVPESSGFRFRKSDDEDAVLNGNDDDRHFRIEFHDDSYWFVPGPGAYVHPTRKETSALKCGPGADTDCVSWEKAPTSGYLSEEIHLEAGFTYMFHVPGDDEKMRYGAVRVSSTGKCPNHFIIFDWAYQTQAGNPGLWPE